MVVRLWVPLTHWLRARNWNLAASGACFTASRVANRVAVSTPLRMESLASAAVMSVVVIAVCLLGCDCLMVAVLRCDGFVGLCVSGLLSGRWQRVRRSPAGARRGPGG